MKLVLIEAVLMDNGELISCGKSLGFKEHYEKSNAIVSERPADGSSKEWEDYQSTKKVEHKD